MSHPTLIAAAPSVSPVSSSTASVTGAPDIIARLECERRHCLERARGETGEGEARQFMEAGSLGIHARNREANGLIWLADGGDLWSSKPILFREVPARPASSTPRMTP